MQFQVDLKFLEDTIHNIDISQIQSIFRNLVTDLSSYLEIEPIDKNVKISLKIDSYKDIGDYTSILDYGASTTNLDGVLKIDILENGKFLPFVLLRECYYRFVPPMKKDDIIVKICINQIVENDLQKLSVLRDWSGMIRDSLVDRDFVVGQLDRLQKYFKTQAAEGFKNTVQHFFDYIHKHAMVYANIETFYNNIFNDYNYKTIGFLYDEELIETLYVLTKIFYDDKRYLSVNDYVELYKKLIQKKAIKSHLSVTKFYENLQWINKHTPFAPSYNPIYPAFGVIPMWCVFIFNPLLKKSNVKKLLGRIPFLISPQFAHDNFGFQAQIVFYLPKVYLQDLLDYIRKLEAKGYIIDKKILSFNNTHNILNLNSFADIANRTRLINPLLKTYKTKYEITLSSQLPRNCQVLPLSMLEMYLLRNLARYSTAGLTFDKRRGTLNALKKAMDTGYLKQIRDIKDFRTAFTRLFNIEGNKDFLYFLDSNKENGFFYLYETLRTILHNLQLIEEVLSSHPAIASIYALNEYLKSGKVSKLFEENITLKEGISKNSILYEATSKYFQSKKEFEKQKQSFQLWYEILDCCFNLKILNIDSLMKIIEDPDRVAHIHTTKEHRLEKTSKLAKLYKITNQKVESIISKFLNHNPPLIDPYLINCISTSAFAKYFPIIFIKSTSNIQKKVTRLQSYFPRLIWASLTDLYSHEECIMIAPYSINIKEKDHFISALYNIFGDNLIFFKRYFWKGLQKFSKITYTDFYDFENQQYFYTKDLFEQLFLYTKKIFGNGFSLDKKVVPNINPLFWSRIGSMKTLVEKVRIRSSLQQLAFTLQHTNKLTEFRHHLHQILLDTNRFKEIKEEEFFKVYIKSIHFIPALRKFGLSKYYLYLLPDTWDDIDLKLLFTNSFQNVKYSASFSPNQFIYATYLFPHRNPKTAHINWATKSKKTVKEYCLFFVKKIYEVIHFDYSLSSEEGWDYSSAPFKTHAQEVLFNSQYHHQLQNVREFNIEELTGNSVCGLDSPEYRALCGLYNQKSFDLKSFIGTTRTSIVENIKTLLEKKLIFPYLSLKNLDMQDKVSIILPDINPEFKTKLLNIFSFFNICRVYETEGEFFIKGFPTSKSFETGLLVEIWFPQCELDEFFDIFDLVFEYLEIKHFLILTDLVDGTTLIKNVFGNLDFLDSYKPLTNLIWNEKDKIWINHKLYNEKEPLYPDLFFGQKNSRKGDKV